MSIDDTSNNGHRSPAIDNSVIKGRTPNASTSPNHDSRSINEKIINNISKENRMGEEDPNMTSSTKTGTRIQQHVLANKMKDLNKHAMGVGKPDSQNNNYMNFGSTRGVRNDVNQSMQAEPNVTSKTKNTDNINFNKSMEVNFD